MENKNRISDLKMEQMALGEIAPEDINDDNIKNRMENIRIENERLINSPEFSDAFKNINAQVKNSNRHKLQNKITAYLAAAAVISVIVFFSSVNIQNTSNKKLDTLSFDIPTGYQNRIKGDGLAVYIKENGKIRLLHDGEKVKEGDVIESRFRSGKSYGVLISIDGRKNVTLHFPPNENSSTSLKKKYPTRAYMLDDAPEFERFIFVTSDKPIDVKNIILQVEKTPDPQNIKKFFNSHANIKEYSVTLTKQGSLK